MSSKSFIIALADRDETEDRAVRRVVVNTEVLKALKLCAGDVVAIVGTDNSNKNFAIGVIWPSLEISTERISVSCSLLLTADLREESKAQMFPLNGKRPAGIPSQHNEAAVIRLREVSRKSSSGSKGLKDKKRDWLTLLLKESLVDLKYITNFQTLEVFYEGRIRRFTVSAVSAEPHGPEPLESLSDGMRTLSVDVPAQLWTVGGDTLVTVEDQE